MSVYMSDFLFLHPVHKYGHTPMLNMYVFMHACMCVCMYIYIYIYVSMCIYIYICIIINCV